ncbi:hypothetical protein CFSAN001627_02820, partial [Clostridium botulinum CFSAN001627]
MVGYKMANINDLRIGINQTLDKEFPNINIYGEEIKQGFEEPCFLLRFYLQDRIKNLILGIRKIYHST